MAYRRVGDVRELDVGLGVVAGEGRRPGEHAQRTHRRKGQGHLQQALFLNDLVSQSVFRIGYSRYVSPKK